MPVSGVYAKLRTGGMHWVIWPLSIIRDDDVWSGRVDDQATLVDMGNYNYDNSFWGLNEMWNQYYGMIKVANAALESLDSYAENIKSDADMKNYHTYCGEVRFLRAYAYYRLVQGFGSVTILRSNSQTDMTRSTIDAVNRYMLEDLEYGYTNMPLIRPNESKHFGAVTAYSAMALAAKVYLNMGNYAKVKELTDKIISSKKFELYDDYYNLFKIPGKLCNESLFECQCTDFGNGSGDMVDADQWFVFQGPANNGNISGWGFIGLYKEFRDWAAARGEGIRATTSFLLAGSTTPSGDVIRPLQNPTQTDCWNGKAYTPSNQLTEGRTKYGSNNNVRILRYADVLLMHSELTGTNTGLNMVHQRSCPGESLSYSIENIRKERAIEFAFEGIHFWDIMRYEKDGAYAGRAIAAAQNGAKVINGGVETTTSFKVDNFTAKKGLMQIPNTQITLSGGVLTQNAGW